VDSQNDYVQEQIDKVIIKICKRKGKTQKKPKKPRAANVPSNYLAVSKDEMPKCDCNAERIDQIQKGRLLLYEQKRKSNNGKKEIKAMIYWQQTYAMKQHHAKSLQLFLTFGDNVLEEANLPCSKEACRNENDHECNDAEPPSEVVAIHTRHADVHTK
jgi:hypothetical protein